MEFLRWLLVNAEPPIYWVLDGHPVHARRRSTNSSSAKQEGHPEWFTLPPYSSELNPDEWVWNGIKRRVAGGTRIESKVAMRSLARGAQRKLPRSTETLKRPFHEKHVA